MGWFQAHARQLVWLSRWFALLTAGLLIGVFVNTLVHSTPVGAVDATWDNWDIIYKDEKYSRSSDTSKNNKLGLPSDSYVFINEKPGGDEVRVIHFSSGDNLSSLSSADYSVYSFTPPNTYTKQSTTTISIESPSENSANVSCDVQGIGWAICPLANNLSSAMDWMYDQLKGFLEVRPLETTNENSGIHIAWNIMRNIANVAFIVAFLIIIYSQLTSVGLSNYGIKKMLPRLVIAALLVNMSFVICAVLLDLSNITGYALQDMFIGIKNTVMTLGQNTNTQAWGWEEVTTAVLSDGAFVVGLATLAGMGVELAYFLVPLLVGLSLALLLVLLVLAARQALIIILIIISPLAFVAYLLPGTEKWFDKWKNAFLTMLIFFPAFAMAFGGAQLAGMIIIQNATGPNGAVMHILGMAVQIAPLAMVPMMMKLGGGVLNRIAGVVNNKNKGLFDRSVNFAKDLSKTKRNNKLANASGIRPFSKSRRYFDHKKRARKESLDLSEKNAENSYGRSRYHKQLNMQVKQAEAAAAGIAAADENRYEEAKAGGRPADIGRSFSDRTLRRFSSKYSARADLKQQQFNDEAQELSQNLALQGIRKSNAQRQQNRLLAKSMLENEAYLNMAAGSVYEQGRDAALATAISSTRSETAKSIEEAGQILKHFNVSSEQRQEISHGRVVNLTDSNGNIIRTFDGSASQYIREAAIEEQLSTGTSRQVAELIADLPAEFRGTVSSALAKSGVKNKAPFLGGKLIDDIVKGDIIDQNALYKYIAEWIEVGKFKAGDMAITDADAAKILQEVMASPNASLITDEKRVALKDKITTALTDSRLNSSITDVAEAELRRLQGML